MADKLRFLSTQDLLERAYRAIDNSQRILLEFTAKSNALDDRKRNLYLAELEREKEMDPRSDD